MSKLRRRRKGTLHIIGAMLVVSASLRLGAGTGEAVAESLLSPSDATEAAVEIAEVSDAEKSGILRALQEREEKVAAREAALDDRLRALALAEAELNEQLIALQEAEAALRATVALADGAAESDLMRLTTVYENMKPKDAAALFEEMTPDFAAGFLGMMRPDAAAAVMTLLDPQTAYSISVILAGRNVNVPTD